ncbi:MAG: response regulator transcription factor [Clostridium sp.]|nr:response regulator transcription factor [Clostridium sp.]PWM45071.1 MAG: DNA-binding response regulator [Clostridia bacterium]
MPAILIVDDEQKMREFVALFLRSSKYTVFEAADGRTALNILSKGTIDLIVLDIMLPDISGFDLCSQIRVRSSVPIIFLTALADEEYQMIGYRVEGDDYITKPFNASILLAKIQRILQRCAPLNARSDALTFRGIKLEISSRRVTLDGKPLQLTPKEFDLLLALMQNRGKVLTRTFLLETIWGYSFAGDSRVVDSHIKKLRSKVSPYSSNIKTVISIGYKLEE